MQWVQPPARSIHVVRGLSVVESKKLLPEPVSMFRLNARLRTSPKELLDAFVPEALYGAAVSAYETKEIPKAKEFYKQLITDFPNSGEASKARSKLGSKL